MEREIINYPHIHGVSFTDTNIPHTFISHWHNAAEFIVVLKSGCKFKIDGKIYNPKAGDILLIWPRELHELINVPDKSIAFVQFSSYLIESNFDFVAVSHFLSYYHHICKTAEKELTLQIKELIYKIRDIQKTKIQFSETRCKLIIYELLLLIGDYVIKEHQLSLGNENYSDRLWEYIRYACRYISEHSKEDITQAQVAQKTGLSLFYFSKLFNEYTKMSFPSYLASIRVQNAISLLENKNLSVTECAFEAGFQSTTTFNKLFHELTGCSPREYRKLHSRNPT